jgi:hypothetical protein
MSLIFVLFFFHCDGDDDDDDDEREEGTHWPRPERSLTSFAFWQ